MSIQKIPATKAIQLTEKKLRWKGKERKIKMSFQIEDLNDMKFRYELIEKLHQESLEDPVSSRNRIDCEIFDDSTSDKRTRYIFSQNNFIINLMIWHPLFETNYRVLPEYIVPMKASSDSIAKVCHRIDDNLMYRGDVDCITLSRLHHYSMAKYGLSRICYDYGDIRANTFSLYDLADFMHRHPRAVELMNTTYANTDMSTGEVEKDIICRALELKQMMIDDGMSMGQWLGMGGCISDSQFSQVFISIGFVSDMNSEIDPNIIDTSGFNGIKKPSQYQRESGKGRKAILNNSDKLPTSGWLDKKLMFAALNDIDYDMEDCGTNQYLRVKLDTFKTYSRYRWQYTKEGDIIDELDLSKIGEYIEVRSPALCAGPAIGRGVCLKCYGRRHKTVENFHAGRLGGKGFCSTSSSQILATKHFQVTKTMTVDASKFSELTKYVSLKRDMLIYTPQFKCNKIGFLEYEIEGVEEICGESDSGGEDSFIPIRPTAMFVEDRDGEIILIELTTEGAYFELSTEMKDFIVQNSATSMSNNSITWFNITTMKKGAVLMDVKSVNSEIIKHFDELISRIDNNRKFIQHVTSVDEVVELFNDFLTVIGATISAAHVEMFISNLVRAKGDNNKSPDFRSVEKDDCDLLGVSRSIRNSSSVSTMLLFESIKSSLGKVDMYIKTASGPNDPLLMHSER